MNIFQVRELRSLKLRLSGIFILATAALSAAAFFYYRHHRAHLEADAAELLRATAVFKADQILNWRRDRLDRTASLLDSPVLSIYLEKLAADPGDRETAALLKLRLERFIAHSQFDSAYLTDAAGHIKISAGEALKELCRPAAALVKNSPTRPVMGDLHHSPDGKKHGLHIAAQAAKSKSGTKLYLVLTVKPEDHLYRLVQKWPGPSTTGETLLIRKEGGEVVFLNELRHAKDTALKLRLPLKPDLPAAMAAQGATGSARGVDYRGKKVLSHLSALPEFGWYMVTKIDMEEVLANTDDIELLLLLGVLLFMGAVGAAAYAVFSAQTLRLSGELHRVSAERLRALQDFETVFKTSPTGKSITAIDGTVRPNQALCEMLGYSEEELRRKNWREITPKEDIPATETRLKDLIEGRKDKTRFEKRYIRKDGSVIWGDVSTAMHKNDAGKPDYFITSVMDITDRKRAEAALSKLQRLYAESEAIGQVGGWELDLDTGNQLWTAEVYRIHEVDQDFNPNLDKGVSFYAPASRPIIEAAVKRAMDLGEPFNLELQIITAKGNLRDVLTIGKADKAGRRLYGFFQDITDRKRAEADLKRSEKDLKEAQRLARMGNWTLDLLTNKLSWSEEIFRIFELDPAGFGASYEAFLDAIHPEDRELVNKAYTDSLRERSPYAITHRLRMKDGRVKHVSEFCETFYDEAGKPLKSIGTVQDITERVRLEKVSAARIHLLQFARNHSLDELLEETLNRCEDLSGSVIGFYHFLDEDQQDLTLQNWSTRTKTRFCYAKGKGSHYPIAQAGVWVDCVRQRRPVIHNDYASLEHKKGLPEGHAPVVREMVVPVIRDGVIKAIMGVGNKPCDYDKDDLAALAMLADLAWETVERKQAEEAVEESEKRFRQLFETMEEGFATHEIICDELGKPVDYRFLEVNPAFERLTGMKRDSLLGKTVREAMPGIEKSWIEAYGRVALEGSSLHMENFARELNKWFEVTAFSPKRGQFAVSFFDVTARKLAEMEMEKLNKELVSKNQEMENFLYITTHDLRSPLVNIQGFSRNLAGYLEEFRAVCGRVSGLPDEDHAKVKELFTQKAPEALGFILDSSRKMDALITALLKVSRAGRVEMKPERVETGEVVRKILDAMRFQLQETGAKVHTGPLPACLADPVALNQIFTNLLDNAVKYRDKGRPLAVEVTGERLGEKVVFKVTDNGPGIPSSDLGRIWNIFYASSGPAAAGKGEGIGLPMVKRLVDKNGGSITVSSKEGTGTEFSLELPAPAED